MATNEAYEKAIARVKRDSDWERSLVASTVIGVMRDRAVSSYYGMFAALTQSLGGIPTVPYDVVFSEKAAGYVEESLDRLPVVGEQPIYPLFGHESDLIGQMARLLTVCREGETLDDETREIINRDIAALEITVSDMEDGDYITHLRNAIAHGHFGAEVDREDPLGKSKLVFVDVKPWNEEVTAVIETNADQLNAVIDAIIDGMCGYLAHS